MLGEWQSELKGTTLYLKLLKNGKCVHSIVKTGYMYAETKSRHGNFQFEGNSIILHLFSWENSYCDEYTTQNTKGEENITQKAKLKDDYISIDDFILVKKKQKSK